MKATVSEKGQVTIPKRLRDRLGLRPGQILDFEEANGTLVARKTNDQDAVDRVFGIIELDVSVDAPVEDIRGPADGS